MRINVLTLFPEMFPPILGGSILGRAVESGQLSVNVIDIRVYSTAKHRNADDYPFGGGAGMVMNAAPIVAALRDITWPPRGERRIYLSPRGRLFSQKVAFELAAEDEFTLLCGHYEGVDERALIIGGFEELSIGDYVLTGGELAAMVVIDAVTRLLPGVISEESPQDESFGAGGGLLEYPQYTRPREIEGLEAPDVLLGGNHARIAAWRREQAIRVTRERRPELLDG